MLIAWLEASCRMQSISSWALSSNARILCIVWVLKLLALFIKAGVELMTGVAVLWVLAIAWQA